MDYDDFGDAGDLPPPPAVTAESINKYIKSKRSASPLADQGANFMKWGLQYNMDPRLMVSIAGHESGFGTNVHPGSFNPFGLMQNGRILSYDDWDDAMNGLGKSLSHDYNMSSTEDMYKKRYCQSGNCADGAANINQFMQEQGADLNALHFPWPSQNDD